MADESDKEFSAVRVLSVDGPFNSRLVLDMPRSLYESFFDALPSDLAPSHAREGIERDLAALTGGADSVLAASARTLAAELENPYASATAKSLCAKALIDVMRELRSLAPPKKQEDRVDEIAKRREERVARAAG